jgi:glycerol transport system ATP-binding protein
MARIDLVDLAHSYSGNAADPESFALKDLDDWRQGGACAARAVGLRQTTCSI